MDVRLSVVSHDNEAEEATIQISDGEISVIAYCHPFDFSLVSSEIVLDALFVKNILQVNQFCLPKKTKEGYYSYCITAEVIDQCTCKVKLGNIFITLDEPIPKDIPNGAFITFQVGRIDLRYMASHNVPTVEL